MKKYLLFTISFFLLTSLNAQNLKINEFLASNDSDYYDLTTDNYPDWIEIYNAGTEAIDIGGMYITDDLAELTLWQIPTTAPDTTTIPAGSYLLLLADKKPEAGILHVNIKLGGSGEQIGLTLSDTVTIVDSLTFGEQTKDISMGRLPDGSSTWEFFSLTSAGASNNEGTVVSVEADENETIISKYELGQNYPNPFNPSTIISFSIPESGLVALKVFNVLGQEVAELVNEIKTAGSYKVSFNASTLTTGIYLYQIQSGTFSDTKKLLYLK